MKVYRMRMPKLYRAMTMSKDDVDEEARTVVFSFSSETPVLRWFGYEILDHSRDAVELERLKAAGPHLVMHDWHNQIGAVQDAWLKSKRGYVKVLYSKRPEAECEWQDVLDGIRVNTSVGYWPKEMKLVKKEEGKPSTYLVTKWEPFETSNVSVAADITVGHGRSAPGEDEETIECLVREMEDDDMNFCPHCGTKMVNGTCPKCRNRSGQSAIATMVEKADREAAETRSATPGVSETPPGDQRAGDPQSPGQANVVRIEFGQAPAAAGATGTDPAKRGTEDPAAEARNQILEAGAAYGEHALANQAVRDGKSLAEFQAILLEKLKIRGIVQPVKETDADLGLNKREVSKYRVLNLVRAICEPKSVAFQKAAGFELECAQAYQRKMDSELDTPDPAEGAKMNREAGLIIPPEILRAPIAPTAVARGAHELGIASEAQISQSLARQQRAFQAGDADAGGYLVDTTTLYSSMIGYMWAAIVVSNKCSRLTGLRGNILIPKEIGEAGAYWIAEDGSTTETTGADMFGMVGAVARTMGIRAAITRKLMLQSSIDVEMWFRAHLGNKHGAEIERVLINGQGANGEPCGILNTDGIGSVDFEDTAVSWPKAVELWTDIAAANANVNGFAFVTNAHVVGQGMVTPKVAGFPNFIINDMFRIGPWEVAFTNHVPSNLGAGSNRSAMIGGYFPDLILCSWGGWELVRDATSSNTAQTILKSYMDVDTVVRQVGSFSAGTNIDHAA